MSRNRKWWHKCNHDRVMRDQFVWSLPDRALGVLMRLECMTGSTDEGGATGFVCAEDGSRVSVDDFIFLFARGDEQREKQIVDDLHLLARVKQLCPRALERGQLRLLSWAQDQEMPASQDNARKRSAADEKLLTEASAWGDELERLSARLGGRRAFSDDEVLSYIKARRNGYAKTNLKFLEFLIESGVCARGADGLVTLASLASPAPAGVGFSGVGCPSTQDAGASGEVSLVGKFPQERELETESRKGRHSSSQLDSAGRMEGGAGEASDRLAGPRERPAFCRTPVSASGSPPDASCPEDGGRKTEVGAVHGFERSVSNGGTALVEPGDAYRCADPLRAAIEFLERSPGWSASRYGDRPCSATVMRAKWRDLRQAIGAEESERIWRVVLDQAITDKLERQGWRNWVGLFLTRVDRQAKFIGQD